MECQHRYLLVQDGPLAIQVRRSQRRGTAGGIITFRHLVTERCRDCKEIVRQWSAVEVVDGRTPKVGKGLWGHQRVPARLGAGVWREA